MCSVGDGMCSVGDGMCSVGDRMCEFGRRAYRQKLHTILFYKANDGFAGEWSLDGN